MDNIIIMSTGQPVSISKLAIILMGLVALPNLMISYNGNLKLAVSGISYTGRLPHSQVLDLCLSRNASILPVLCLQDCISRCTIIYTYKQCTHSYPMPNQVSPMWHSSNGMVLFLNNYFFSGLFTIWGRA